MATGKSKMAIDFINGIKAKRVLLLCPKTIIPVWPDQFKIHSARQWRVEPLTKGSVRKKAMQLNTLLRDFPESWPLCIVINYDSFWRSPLGPVYNKQNRITDFGVLASANWDALILDECHRIKSPGSKSSWGVARIAKKSLYRIGLSGTPMPHSPLDAYAQFRAIEPNLFGTSFVNFRARYCVMGGFEGRQILNYQNMEEFNTLLAQKMMVVNRRDVLDLPDVQHEYRYVDISTKARKVYETFKKEMIAEIIDAKTGEPKEISTGHALTKMLRLSQIAGGYVQFDDGSNQHIDNAKIDAVQEIAEDIDVEEPLIIFCRFKDEIWRVKHALMNNPDTKLRRTVAELSGRINQLAEWQAGKFNTIVIQIQSGAEGINLTRSRYTIYISKGLDGGKYEQSLARMDRPEQTREGVYFHILASNTIDIKENQALKLKKRVIDFVLDSIKKEKAI